MSIFAGFISGFGSQGSGEKGPSSSGQRPKQSKSEGVAASLVPSKIRHKRDEKREKKEAEKAAAAAAAALNSIQEAATGGASSHDDHVALIPPGNLYFFSQGHSVTPGPISFFSATAYELCALFVLKLCQLCPHLETF